MRIIKSRYKSFKSHLEYALKNLCITHTKDQEDLQTLQNNKPLHNLCKMYNDQRMQELHPQSLQNHHRNISPVVKINEMRIQQIKKCVKVWNQYNFDRTIYTASEAALWGDIKVKCRCFKVERFIP